MSQRKSFVELAEEHAQAWRTLFDELAKSLGLYQLADWINDKLTKEGE